MNSRGFIAPTATISHASVVLGSNVFIGENVLIYQDRENTRLVEEAGPVEIEEKVHIYQEVIIEVGAGGSLQIGKKTRIQPRCHFASYAAPIVIGAGVQIATKCSFFPFDHGLRDGELIGNQPLQTKGPIVIEDDAWLGVGVTVLSGVRIGKGAVIGAGAVVTHNIPDKAIACGIPARVIKIRSDATSEHVPVSNRIPTFR